MRSRGFAISEYSFTVALVSLACLGALALLGQALYGNLSSTASSDNSAQYVSMSEYREQAAESDRARNSQTQTTVSLTDSVLTLRDGTRIDLSRYPSDIGASVATSGANGTTTLLLAQLTNITDQLKAAGKLTPTQENLLRNLANQGYRMSEIESLIERAFANSSNLQEFNAMQHTFEGRVLTTQQLYSLLGYNRDGFPDNSAFDPMQAATANPENRAFLELYQQVQASGVLTDPTLNTLVTGMSTEILKIAEYTETATRVLNEGGLQPTDAADYIVKQAERHSGANVALQVSNSSGSAVSNANSAGICQVGNCNGN